jgi:hypothetical protein
MRHFLHGLARCVAKAVLILTLLAFTSIGSALDAAGYLSLFGFIAVAWGSL